MKTKLKLFGHSARMDNIKESKKCDARIMGESNRKGRPCREWLDDIKE